jgi:hypothetical protein
MLSEVLKDHQLQAKFMVLQLVLLLAKFQALTARIVVWCGLIACEPPITPAVYANCKFQQHDIPRISEFLVYLTTLLQLHCLCTVHQQDYYE